MGERASDRREEAAAELRRFDVPPGVIEHILDVGQASWVGLAYLALLIATMVGGFAVGGLWLWPRLEALTIANATAHARAIGGVLYHANFGFSLVLALFGWIFVAGAIAGLVLVRTPRLRAAMLLFSAQHARGPIDRWALRAGLKQAAGVQDPLAYVRRWADVGNRVALLAGAAVLAVSTVAVVRDVNAHSVFTPAAYIRAPFFPWGQSEPRQWASAAEVEVGCNHIERRYVEDDLIYRVRFASGAWVDIGSSAPLPGGDWLDAVERIDARLRYTGASFRRWSWMQRDPLHPACLAAMHSRFAADYPRIERLLRVGELPDR